MHYILLLLLPILGGLLLLIACSICKVQSPGLLGAALIQLVAGVGSAAVEYMANSLTEILCGKAGMGIQGTELTSGLIALPVSIIICACLYAMFLKTTIKKGLIIWVIQALIGGAVCLVLWGFAFII